MLAMLVDFRQQKNVMQAIGFAIFWTFIQILAVSGVVILTLNFDRNVDLNISMLSVVGLMCAVSILPLVGFLSVYRKWGAGNGVNIILFGLAIVLEFLSGISFKWLPSIVLLAIVLVLLAMRPSGKSDTKSLYEWLTIVFLIVIPLSIIVGLIWNETREQKTFLTSPEINSLTH